jgi:hypothetical protein
MYKWNVENEKYEPCEEFKSIKHYFGFSIGWNNNFMEGSWENSQ